MTLFDTPLRTKADTIFERTLQMHGPFDLSEFADRDPFEQLIKTMLSHRTTHADERAAFDAMWSRYGDWEAVRTADVDELTALLSPSRYPDQKARNIQRTLTQIKQERGAYNIDFLADMHVLDARDWLMSLPGVGIKTASLVLLFIFQMSVMPVDTHVYRVSRRTGLIDPNLTAEKAHMRLLDLLPDDPQLLFRFHRATLVHGQRVCYYNNPACHRCPLQEVCDAYQGENDLLGRA